MRRRVPAPLPSIARPGAAEHVAAVADDARCGRTGRVVGVVDGPPFNAPPVDLIVASPTNGFVPRLLVIAG
jgi:hypothetical protein